MVQGALPYNVRNRSVNRILQGTPQGDESAHSDGKGAFFSCNAPLRCVQGAAAFPMLKTLLFRLKNNLLADNFNPVAINAMILLCPEDTEETLKDFKGVLATFASSEDLPLTDVQASTRDIGKAVCQVTMVGSEIPAEHSAEEVGDTQPGDAPAQGNVPATGTESLPATGPEAGTDIVQIGRIGAEGAYLLADNQRDRIDAALPAMFADHALAMEQELDLSPSIVILRQHHFFPGRLIPLGEGGILAGLWDLADWYHTGFTVDLHAIVIAQETVEITEVFGINPYKLASTGAGLFLTTHGPEVCELLRDARIDAAIIGQLSANRDKIIKNGEEVSHLNRPDPDEVYRCI